MRQNAINSNTEVSPNDERERSLTYANLQRQTFFFFFQYFTSVFLTKYLRSLSIRPISLLTPVRHRLHLIIIVPSPAFDNHRSQLIAPPAPVTKS